MKLKNTSDYTAGCVPANRLTEDRHTKALVLEAGGWDYDPWIHIPLGTESRSKSTETIGCSIPIRLMAWTNAFCLVNEKGERRILIYQRHGLRTRPSR